MKNLLRLEELAQFLFCLLLLIMLEPPWWCYGLMLIGPDVSMLGYLVDPRVGAFSYNLFHHKGVALAVFLIGFSTGPFLDWLGLILYGHASMDRIFGYGLKFGDNFHHTHLGWIGKLKGKEQ